MVIDDMPEPGCPPGGAVIRVVACAVCPSDIKMARVGHRDLSYPRILGHEVVGVVERSEALGLVADGDTVQVWPGIACGTCLHCRRGQDNLCDRQGIIGFNRDGGFAERMAVPAETIRRGGVNIVPAGLDPAMASLTEPLACCVHGQDAAFVAAEDRVVVHGGGPMGLMHAALAASKEASVLVLEPEQERRELALRMGADRAADPLKEDVPSIIEDWTEGRGADVTILATPHVRIDDALLRTMGPRGRLCAFSGLPRNDAEVRMDINLLHYRELQLVGAYGCTSTSNAQALSLLGRGEVDLRPLMTERMPLGSIERAFGLIEQRKALKCVITEFSR
jgi:L-iditol 2-dehydrogenase